MAGRTGQRFARCESNMQRRAIFGGTFNPVHWGHHHIVQVALEQVGLHQVIWVPSYQPPHKTGLLLAFEQRLAMLRLVTATDTRFVASDVEARREGRSYAIATLHALQQEYPDTEWYWIVGTDTFQGLPRWQQAVQLATSCIWLVAPRQAATPGAIAAQICHQLHLKPEELRWQALHLSPIEISSSLVRQRCQHGESIQALVPTSVSTYITRHKLYR